MSIGIATLGKFSYRKGTMMGAKHITAKIGGAGGGVERPPHKPKVIIREVISNDKNDKDTEIKIELLDVIME
jgi:hypothetical protein